MIAEAEFGGVNSICCSDENVFGLVKVLEYLEEEEALYVRIFKRRVSVRSTMEWFASAHDPEQRTLDNVLGIDIGMLPITVSVFRYWKPEFLFRQEVTVEEERLVEEHGQFAQPWDELRYP
jgi:hypothetical protein